MGPGSVEAAGPGQGECTHGRSSPQKKEGGGEENGRRGRARVSPELRGHPDETLACHGGAVGSGGSKDEEEGTVASEASGSGVRGQGQ